MILSIVLIWQCKILIIFHLHAGLNPKMSVKQEVNQSCVKNMHIDPMVSMMSRMSRLTCLQLPIPSLSTRARDRSRVLVKVRNFVWFLMELDGSGQLILLVD